MIRFQVMKPTPNFRQRQRGDEQTGRILPIAPRHKSRIGPRFFRLADRIRVEDEIHSWNGRTRSSGIRGGSQSVVSRMESSHAFNRASRRRAVILCFAVWERCFKVVSSAFRASNQPNNSRACRAESFFTFLTATSTALINCRLYAGSMSVKRARIPLLPPPILRESGIRAHKGRSSFSKAPSDSPPRAWCGCWCRERPNCHRWQKCFAVRG